MKNVFRASRQGIAATVAAALLGTTIALAVPTAASANSETANNDTPASATKLTLGAKTTAVTFDNSGKDIDYFSFTLPSAGQVNLDIRFPSGKPAGHIFRAELQVLSNGEPQNLFGTNVLASDYAGTAFNKEAIFLSKGTYYVEIESSMTYTASWNMTYSVQVNHTPGLVEAEPTGIDGFPLYNTIPLGKAAKGSSFVDFGVGSDDMDLWAFNAPADGQYVIDFRFAAGGSGLYPYQLDFENSKGKDAGFYRPAPSEYNGAKLRSQKYNFTKGLNLILVTSVGDSLWGKQYTIKVDRYIAPALKNLTAKKPSISGTKKVGKKLTVKTAAWKPGGVKYSYQWLRNGKAIKGATKKTYTLKKADQGKKISVKVTGKKSGYKTLAKTSSATTKIKKK